MARVTFGPSGQRIRVSENGDREIIREPEDPGNVGGIEDVASGVEEDTRDDSVVDPSPETERIAATDPTTAERPKRKYTRRSGGPVGRPRKTAAPDAPSEETLKTVNENIANFLESIHQMVADFTKTPELEISHKEAECLRDATIELAKAHNMSSVVSPKTLAKLNFVVAVGGIYAPRIMLVATKKPKQGPQIVQQMPPRNASGLTIKEEIESANDLGTGIAN